MAEQAEHNQCAECGAELEITPILKMGVCPECGWNSPNVLPPLGSDPRRRHTPEDAARRKKHGGAR